MRRQRTGRRVKFEEVFLFQEVYCGDPEERKSHMNFLAGWAVLDCGAAKSLVEAERAPVMAQACEKRSRKAGDDRKVESVEEKYHFPRTGEQVITPIMKVQVLWSSRRTRCTYVRASRTDGSTPTLVGNDHLHPWRCIDSSVSW